MIWVENFTLNQKLKTEAAVQRCSSEKVFLNNAAILQENTHAVVRFQ